jgi:hypothetical protein
MNQDTIGIEPEQGNRFPAMVGPESGRRMPVAGPEQGGHFPTMAGPEKGRTFPVAGTGL